MHLLIHHQLFSVMKYYSTFGETVMKKVSLQQLLIALMALILSVSAFAGAPLPLQSVEGNSGVLFTSTAYLANPPEDGKRIGKPSVAAALGIIGDKDFESFGVTINIDGRWELGYAFERLGLGDWPDEVKDIAGLHVENNVGLHNFNLRYMAIQEGDFDAEWMPAITVGAHFKWNQGLDHLNRQTTIGAFPMGLMNALGADRDHGVEFTAVASKTITDLLPNPMIVSVGLRNGDAIHTGLVGFAGQRSTTIEASIIYFLTERLALACEYRQKSDHLNNLTLGGTELVRQENDWWDILLAYVVNDNFTVAGGYVNYGNVLDDQADTGWALQLKYEF